MGGQSARLVDARAVRALVRRQHGVIARTQLLGLGVSRRAIEHRIKRGRLHRVRRGVYAVGRRELTRDGRWVAAILSVGRGAVLSHESAAALWSIEDREGLITISLPSPKQSRSGGLRVHSVRIASADLRTRRGIPLTSPARTLIDLATTASRERLEHALNAADRSDLTDPERLRKELAEQAGLRGTPALRAILDERTFVLTASGLERRFLPLASRAGLPRPETAVWIAGYEVDFHWPDLGLVVETDGLRYHRTPSQLERDSRRDQAHAAMGLRTLRFSHSQVRYDPESVVSALAEVAEMLRSSPGWERAKR